MLATSIITLPQGYLNEVAIALEAIFCDHARTGETLTVDICGNNRYDYLKAWLSGTISAIYGLNVVNQNGLCGETICCAVKAQMWEYEDELMNIGYFIHEYDDVYTLNLLDFNTVILEPAYENPFNNPFRPVKPWPTIAPVPSTGIGGNFPGPW